MLPATNAPRAPIIGAKKGQVPPARCATYSASTSGMLSSPDALAPESINTRTSATANNNATAGHASMRNESLHAFLTSWEVMRCRSTVRSETTIKIVPGR